MLEVSACEEIWNRWNSRSFDMVKEQDEEIGSVLEENEYKMCSGEQCMSGSVDRNHSTILCPLAPTSSDWCRKTTQFADLIACKEIDLVSTIGDSQATSVTEERLELWKTGWSSVKHILKEVQSESMLKLFVWENIAPHGSDKSASDDLSNVQISGSMVDGQEVVVSASSLMEATFLDVNFDGSKVKPIDASSGFEICDYFTFSLTRGKLFSKPQPSSIATGLTVKNTFLQYEEPICSVGWRCLSVPRSWKKPRIRVRR